MKWQETVDTFREEAQKSWTVGNLNIVMADRAVQGRNTVKGNDAEKTDNAELYRVAKVLLQSAKCEKKI